MHCFRRAAVRLLSSPAALSVRQRSIAPITPSSIKPFQAQRFAYQRRWASDVPSTQPEQEQKEAPAPADQAEEKTVENAVNSTAADSTKPEEVTATEANEQVTENAVDSAAGISAMPEQVPEQASETERPSFSRREIQPPTEENETLYVGNLFFDVTADDLRTEMEKHGIVERATIIHNDRGISKGFGYVTFDNIESAKRAMEAMNMTVYEGRRIVVQFAAAKAKQRVQSRRPVSRTLFIGNMAFEMTDRDLNDLFKDITNVIDVRVAVDRRTGQPRGFAHAEFIDTASAQVAFEMLSKKAPYGRKLRIDYSANSKNPRTLRDPTMKVE